MKCDVSNEDDIKSVFAAAKSHGGIDVCINNAGLNHSCRLLSGVTHEWREMINVHYITRHTSYVSYRSMCWVLASSLENS
jgi:NAD(P)-dependent dehydrogenase (short-subunit alcohol dehydrogenase family)